MYLFGTHIKQTKTYLRQVDYYKTHTYYSGQFDVVAGLNHVSYFDLDLFAAMNEIPYGVETLEHGDYHINSILYYKQELTISIVYRIRLVHDMMIKTIVNSLDTGLNF